MYVKFTFVIFLLLATCKKCVDCSLGDQNFELCEFFKIFRLDQTDLCPIARKINFLDREIKVPDGVSDAIAFEIQKILNGYENQMLQLTQELISCDGSSSQYEKYLRGYNQLKEIESSLREAPKSLKQRFINQADFHSKHSKLFFDVFQVFNTALDIIKDISFLFNFQVNVMKPGRPPSTDSPGNNKPEDKPADKPTDTTSTAKTTDTTTTEAATTEATTTEATTTEATTTAATTTKNPLLPRYIRRERPEELEDKWTVY